MTAYAPPPILRAPPEGVRSTLSVLWLLLRYVYLQLAAAQRHSNLRERIDYCIRSLQGCYRIGTW